MQRTIEISDTHGGRLLSKDEFFSNIASERGIRKSDVDRPQKSAQYLLRPSSRRRDIPYERCNNLNEGQKRLLDRIMRDVYSIKRMSSSKSWNTHGSFVFLHSRARTGNNYILSVLRDIVEHECMLVERKAVTGGGAALCKRERALHNPLG